MNNRLLSLCYVVVCVLGCGSCEEKSHGKAEAYADAVELRNAITSFRYSYDRNPCSDSTNDLVNQRVIIATLMFQPSWCSEVFKLNPDGIRFVHVPPPNRMLGGLWLDPWGNPYHIEIGAIGSNSVVIGGVLVHQPVGVWSDGQNGRNEYGHCDDVVSWMSE